MSRSRAASVRASRITPQRFFRVFSRPPVKGGKRATFASGGLVSRKTKPPAAPSAHDPLVRGSKGINPARRCFAKQQDLFCYILQPLTLGNRNDSLRPPHPRSSIGFRPACRRAIPAAGR